jgi:ParB family chromosome partitioning protein
VSARDNNPRLGRGLAALMGEAPAGEAATPSPGTGPQSLAIDLLVPGPFQPRGPVSAETLEDLTASIKARGILQPLLARPHPQGGGQFQIIAGERRWRAAQLAGLHDVPVLVRSLADTDAMAAALVENLQRQDLNAIEEAEGYKRLLEEFHLTQEQLGEAVGKSRSHIANSVRLLQLPVAVRAQVQAGHLSAGHARALLAHPEPETAMWLVISRDLNVRQTEALATSRKAPSEPRTGSAGNAETLALEQDLSARLGLKVQIGFDGKGGVVKLHYQSLDQLDGLLALLNRG